MMKIFIAGATGAVGRRLIPVLIQRGHQVIGMSRSKDKMKTIRANGAPPVIADAFDAEGLNKALRDTKPDVVIHQLTAIPGRLNLRNIGRDFALTNRLRTEGTDHLLAAAKAAGAHRFIAQSFAGWPYARRGGPVKTEDDPLDPDPPRELRAMLAAIEYSEKAVLESPNLDGVLLRYGFAAPLHLPLPPALGAAVLQHGWIDVPGYDGELSYPRDPTDQRPASAW
jgi:nucleoside-diphosphate-sugar epimerase